MMSDALTTLESTYFVIQKNISMLLAGCKTQAQRDQIMAQYVVARQTYWQAVNKAFHDDDPALQALVTQANTALTKLNAIGTSLGNITTVINDITKAVSIGGEIAAKVIAA
jgi:hypothetical protein